MADEDAFGFDQGVLNLDLRFGALPMDGDDLLASCAAGEWGLNSGAVSDVVNSVKTGSLEENPLVSVCNINPHGDSSPTGNIRSVTQVKENSDAHPRFCGVSNPIAENIPRARKLPFTATGELGCTSTPTPLSGEAPLSTSFCTEQENEKLGNQTAQKDGCAQPQQIFWPVSLESCADSHNPEASAAVESIPDEAIIPDALNATAQYGKCADGNVIHESRNLMPALLFPAGLYRMPRTVIVPTAQEALKTLSSMLKRVPEERRNTILSTMAAEEASEETFIPKPGHVRGRESNPRYTKDARASQFCHVCGKRRGTIKRSCDGPVGFPGADTGMRKRRTGQQKAGDEFFTECSNVKVGLCRKSVCSRCIREYGWLRYERAKEQDGEWTCFHCNGLCPPVARCRQYFRSNAIRRMKSLQARADKANARMPPV